MRLFVVLLVTFWRPKLKKRTAKGHAAFFVLQKDGKKTPKGRQANFVLQLVDNLFWTPKGHVSKKDDKKSWHLVNPPDDAILFTVSGMTIIADKKMEIFVYGD